MTRIQNTQQLDDLEMKAAFQEQTIAELNDELVKHGARIVLLEKQLQRLLDHIESTAGKSIDPIEEQPPPHY